MAKNNEKGPDGLPVDKSEANFGQSDADANAPLREQNLKDAEAAEEALTFENLDNDDEPNQVKVAAATGINPSSTYPGRAKELAENDMAIPTEIDLAKRASFAGTQTPARVHAAGLANLDFEEDAPEETTGDNPDNA